MIGRDEDAEALVAALAQHALVSVRGPLGIGKTALAVQVATSEAEQGRLPRAVQVPLSGVTELRGVLEHAARALGRKRPASYDGGVAAALVRLLEAVPATLILDDADDVEDSELQALAEALRVAPPGRSRVIVVSRRALRLSSAPPSIELGPLPQESMRELVLALESARGRSIYDDVLARAAGNPLVLQLVLVEGVADVPGAVAHAVAEMSASARLLLTVLSAARRPLSRRELEPLVPGMDAVIAELRPRLLIADEKGELGVTPRVANAAAPLLGTPSAEMWRALAQIGERALSAAPADTEAWQLACRAHAHAGDPEAALTRLERCELARASLPTSSLEALVQELAAAAPGSMPEFYVVLAREQLRAGDVERACNTLDMVMQRELAGPLRRRVHLLRMEALVRLGDPRRAAHELSCAEPRSSEPSDELLPLAMAGLTAIGGNITEARRMLRELAPRTRHAPQLEAQRAAWMAMSYMCVERYGRAVVWARRARQEYGKIDAPPSFVALVPTCEVIALLELNRIDEAAALAARLAETVALPSGGQRERFEPMGRDLGELFDAGVQGRRGRLRECLPRLEQVFAALDAQADRVARAVCARYLARTCIGMGEYERAEEYLRVASGVAADPGLGAFKPLVEHEWAMLEEARGRLDEARQRLAATLQATPDNPLACVDAWGIDPRERPLPHQAAGAPSTAAWAAVRAAERALDQGDGITAQAAAQAAERIYEEAGPALEMTRARLLRAESLVVQGRVSQAEPLLTACEATAEQNGYKPLLVAAALVRAAAAERDGRLAACVQALMLARSRAGSDVDAALDAACARMGLGGAVSDAPSPTRRLVQRLGLARPFTHLLSVGDRAFAAGTELIAPNDADAVVDLDGAVLLGREHVSWPQARIELLARLVEAGARGLSLEEMYLDLWKGTEYHPLRHRNMVYVALQRLRAELRTLVGGEPIAHIPEARYAIASHLRIAVRRPLAPEFLGKLVAGVEREAWVAARTAAQVQRAKLPPM